MDQHNVKTATYLYPVSRRNFITSAVASLAVTSFSASPFRFLPNKETKIKAIAFDAFPVFDPRPVFQLVEQMFPGKGTEISNVWRTKQFEYTWLRTIGGAYKNFWQVTEDALIYAASKASVVLTSGNKKELMSQYLSLEVWPDVLPALYTLKQNGIRLSFLSNMTDEMLHSCIRHTKTAAYFEKIISTDQAKTYKPNPRAYQLGMDAFKLNKAEILFVAFAGWDASGAKWFGYPTFWVNRLGTPLEELNAVPDGKGKSMADLLDFILKNNS